MTGKELKRREGERSQPGRVMEKKKRKTLLRELRSMKSGQSLQQKEMLSETQILTLNRSRQTIQPPHVIFIVIKRHYSI